MRFKNIFTLIDSHTEGQPTRVIVSGYPRIPGKTMAERKMYAMKNLDHLRSAIMNEPRGQVSSIGVVLTPPVSEEAAYGVIWMEQGDNPAVRYIDMCGHGSMGIATTLVEMGVVEVKEPITEVVLDMPAGQIRAKAEVKNGKVQRVTIQNVPCFLYESKKIKVPELGDIAVDIAFGGNNYAIVEAKDLKLGTTPADMKKAQPLVVKVLDAINAQTNIQHPEKAHIKGVLALLINDKPTRPEATTKNIYIDETGCIDRSPCGTGTSARMAAKFAKGELKLNESFVTESVLGSIFYGKLVKETKMGSYKAVVPEITGRAFITGINQFVIDDDDPFKYGFIL